MLTLDFYGLQRVRAISNTQFVDFRYHFHVRLDLQGYARRVGPKIKIDTQYLETIKETILSSKEIRIKHNDKTQIVAPYGFLYGNKPYLVAYFNNAKEFRYYALHKLTSVQLTNNHFIKDNTFSLNEFTKDLLGAILGNIKALYHNPVDFISINAFYLRIACCRKKQIGKYIIIKVFID